MYAAAVRSTEKNKSRAIANNVGQRRRGTGRGFGFWDNRPKTVAQRMLQEMSNNVGGGSKDLLRGFGLVDNRPDVISHDRLQSKNTQQTNMTLNSNSIQLEKVDSDTTSSTLISGVINELEKALSVSCYLPDKEKKDFGVDKINKYLVLLRTINSNQNGGLQQQAAELIKSELAGRGGSTTVKDMETIIFPETNKPKPIQTIKSACPIVQRIGVVGGVVVGLAALGGIGALLWGIRRIREYNRDAAVTSSLVCDGSQVTPTGSYASVVAIANLTDSRQRVEYDIRWDATCVPGGAHLDQTPGVASHGFVVDKSPEGHPVGSRTSPMARYFNDAGYTTPNGATGTYFYFRDGIEQPVSYPAGSSWDFRLRVYGINNALLQTHIVNVPWQYTV